MIGKRQLSPFPCPFGHPFHAPRHLLIILFPPLYGLLGVVHACGLGAQGGTDYVTFSRIDPYRPPSRPQGSLLTPTHNPAQEGH
jgi:hypothetical protein